MANVHRPLTRRQKKGLLVGAGAYVLWFVLGMIAMGGVEWPIRLSALAAAFTLLIGGLALLRRKLSAEQRAEMDEPERFTRRDWPYWAVWVLSLMLLNLLGREWAGRFPLLVLGGVLIALPNIAVLWWQVTRRTDG